PDEHAADGLAPVADAGGATDRTDVNGAVRTERQSGNREAGTAENTGGLPRVGCRMKTTCVCPTSTTSAPVSSCVSINGTGSFSGLINKRWARPPVRELTKILPLLLRVRR